MKRLYILVLLVLMFAVGSPASRAAATIQPATPTTAAPIASPSGTETFQPSATPTLPASATPAPSLTPTITPSPRPTESIGEMLKTHIVFYLILPEKGHTDACGDITIEPIISQRYRTGDRLADVQIALNMLLGMHVKRYGTYYSALWDTDLSIASTKYNRENDEMSIDFTGYLPINSLSVCDKHGIREQIWKTFYNYGISQKIFTYNGRFLIDQLNRK